MASDKDPQVRRIRLEGFGGPEVLQLETATIGQPGVGEVLIRVRAAGVNRPDLIQRTGRYPVPADASPIPGLEISGIVHAVGEEVVNVQVGDEVCALTNGGGYADHCLVPAGQVLPLPRSCSFVEGAAIPETFFTVWANLFGNGTSIPRGPVLIHGGTSGIGYTALMLCREFGIAAFATVGSKEKAQAVKALGATPIQYQHEVFADVVLQATGGRGVEVVLDIMGASYFHENLRALAKDGRLQLIGTLGGAVVESVNLMAISSRRIVVTGSSMRPRTREEKAAIAYSLHEHVWPLLNQRRCVPRVDRVFPLEKVGDAHRLMEASTHIGKIVLSMDPH